MKKRVVQLLGGTLLGLALAEGMFWYADDAAFPHLNVYEADATLGARLRPGASQRVAFGGNPVTSVRINAEGFRGADWGPARDGEVVVLGDSQVFGLGVEEDETASAVLATRLGRPVRNAGIPTHGPPEYLAVLDALLASRKPETVVLVLNFSNDVFEEHTPNTQRHAVWDGWAVRLETAPDAITNFPGRRWLFSQSHLVHAIRRAWWTPPEAWEQGVASEGTWASVVGLAQARPEQAATVSTDATGDEVRNAARSRLALEYELVELSTGVFPELREANLDLAVQGALEHAHAGDIVGQSYAESARTIAVTAAQLREGARIRKELDARLTRWVAEHPRDPRAREIQHALEAKVRLDEKLAALATQVSADGRLPAPLEAVVSEAKRRCEDAGAELIVVALPLDVQVSSEEWKKYGAAPQDMSGTRALLTDLTRAAERMGVRALDATDALAAAEPGAFLNADLHMTPKGQAALAAAIAAKLAEPAPLAIPRAGLPPDRSRVPTWEELQLAPEVTVRGSTKNHCSTRKLREWLVVECTAPLEEGAWHILIPEAVKPLGVTVIEGAEALVGGRRHYSAVLVTPLVPGHPVVADFTWADRSERLTVSWEGAQERMAFAPTGEVEPPALAACLTPQSRQRTLRQWFGNVDRGCAASFPENCGAQLSCASGTRAVLPACPAGQANAGSAGHCHDLCDTTRPCATGTCTPWQGAGVCL